MVCLCSSLYSNDKAIHSEVPSHLMSSFVQCIEIPNRMIVYSKVFCSSHYTICISYSEDVYNNTHNLLTLIIKETGSMHMNLGRQQIFLLEA